MTTSRGVFVIILMCLATGNFNQMSNESKFISFTIPVETGVTKAFTMIHNMTVSNCSFVEVNSFLKEKCLLDGRWYFKCSNSYRFYQLEDTSTCGKTLFTRVCPNDTTYYQACGHGNFKCGEQMRRTADSKRAGTLNFRFGRNIAACGYLICQHSKEPSSYPGANPHVLAWLESFRHRYGQTIRLSSHDCVDTSTQCINAMDGIPLKQYGCKEQAMFKCVNSGPIRNDSVCDNKCECEDCDDEAYCNDMAIGIFCFGKSNLGNNIDVQKYIRPYYICDGFTDCNSDIDEKGCDDLKDHCMTSNPYLSSTTNHSGLARRALHPRAKCSNPLLYQRQYRVCDDYRDQMNCSGSTISPLVCNVDGYSTTISEHVICKGLNLCDDNVDNDCLDVQLGCKIHKHRICDGIRDCKNGADEGEFFCKELFPNSTIYCIRWFSRTNLETKLPNRWILDGRSDCRNNEDENAKLWTKRCGIGLLHSYVITKTRSTECARLTQFKCSIGSSYINMDRLCMGNAQENCDSKVCVVARKEYFKKIVSKVENKLPEDGTKRLFHCLTGLHNLENHAGKCSKVRLVHQKKVLGVTDVHVLTSDTFSRSYVDCTNIFGEMYVYLACTEICGDYSHVCPLLDSLEATECLNYQKSKAVYSLTEDGKVALTIVDGKSYSKAFFACHNSRCITLDKVCNLADDCGDLSDEKNCTNNFKCTRSGEYIPLTSKCNGKFDCFDYSDECNDTCDNQIKMFDNIIIKAIAWVVGLLGTFLNVLAFTSGFREYQTLKTDTALVNKFFVMLIIVGDFLQGLFILMLSIGEQFFNKSTCVTQFMWTTSQLCTTLGVLSTVGSLVSLYSMTILSIIRVSKVKSLMRPEEGLSLKKKLYLASATTTILLVALLIALLPIVAFADFFVERLYYPNNPLFVGSPGKEQHMKIVQSYFGRIHHDFFEAAVPWKTLRSLVGGFFTSNEVVGIDIGFYGSNGFCLFSYFVNDKMTYKWFSIAILLSNLICVAIIIVCYIVITWFALKTSNSVSKNTQTDKNNRKLRRKITVIIMTDIFTWLPFIIVCIINYTELADTSSWYSIFCVLFLRINSIINPIGIYDDTIWEWIKKSVSILKTRIGRVCEFIRGYFNSSRVSQECSIEMSNMAVEQCKNNDLTEMQHGNNL